MIKLQTRLFLLIALTLAAKGIFACGGIGFQVYTGEIQYSLNANNPLFCEATISMDFDVNQALVDDSIQLDWGDGTYGILYAVSVTPDSVANAIEGTQKFFTHVYKGKHVYPAVFPGTYFMSLMGQYRAYNQINISQGAITILPYYIEAQVNIDSINYLNAIPALLPPVIGYSGLNDFNQTGIYTPTGPAQDSIIFSLVTPDQDHSTSVPNYQLPDAYCGAGSGSLFTIDRYTAQLSWVAPCSQGQYDVAIRSSIYRGGQLLGSYMRDETIYVSAQFTSGITEQQKLNANLFPNPASNILTVELGNEVSAKAICSIVDMTGQTVKQITVENPKFDSNISNLSAGIYLLRVQQEGQTFMRKFIKQ